MAEALRRSMKVLAPLLLSAAPPASAINTAPVHPAREPVAMVSLMPRQTEGISGVTIGVIAAIVVSVIAAIALVIITLSPSKPKEPRPAAEVQAEVDQLTEQKKTIKDQVKGLEERIETLRIQAAEEKEKAELAAAKAAADYEAEFAGTKTEEELRVEKEAEEEAKNIEEQISAALAKAEEEAEHFRQFAEKAAEKAEELKKAAITGAEQAWYSLEKFAKDTVETVQAEVKEVLDTTATEEEIAEWTQDAEEVGGVAFTMPLPLLLAGVFAPVQLQFVAAWNKGMLFLQIPLFLLFLFAMAWDHGKQCGSGFIWAWTIAITSMLALNVLLRAIAVYLAQKAIDETHYDLPAHGVHRAFASGTLGQWENALHKFWNHVTSSAADYFKVLLVYESISTSCMYSLISFLNLVIIVWGGLGVYMVCAYAVEEETICDANVLRAMVRFYCFIYVTLLIYSLIALVLWLVEAIVVSQAVSLAILKQAWNFDTHYSPSGVPIVSLMVRALLLRNATDMAALELSLLNCEIQELREQRDEFAAEEAELDAAVATAKLRLEVVQKNSHLHATPEELAEKYAEEMTAMMDKVAVAGVMATQLYEKYGPAAIQKVKEKSLALLHEAQEEAAFVKAATEKGAMDLANKAQAQAEELAKDPNLRQLKNKLQEKSSALAGVSFDDVQKKAEEAAKLAAEKTQGLKEAGMAKAHEAGLDNIDVQEIQQQAKEAAEQLVIAAIHKAEDAGLDINALIKEVEEETQKLASSAQELAVSAQQEAKVVATSAQDAAQSAAAQAQEAANAVAGKAQELTESEQAQELQKKAEELKAQVQQATAAAEGSADKDEPSSSSSSWFK